MKKFIVRIVFFFCIVIVVFCAAMRFIPPAKTHYMYGAKIKNERLDTLASPRLVLVGGSNVAFGIESGLLEDSLRFNVQNAALHAGMGLRFILGQASERLKEGDVLVIMPEYQHFYGEAYGDDEAFPQAVIYIGLSSLKELNARQLLNLIEGAPKAVVGNVLTLLRPNSREDVYSPLGLNCFGDVDAHYGMPSKSLKPMVIEGDIDYDYVEELSSKVLKLRAQGYKVYLFPPVMIQSVYEQNQAKIDELAEALRSRCLGFEVPPTAMLQPDSLAYDTPYHMSYPAAHDNTLRLLHYLKDRGLGSQNR